MKRLVRDLHLPVEIVVMPIVREADGLACASRNRYLSPEERLAAPVLYRALKLAEKMYSEGERSAGRLLKVMRKEIEREPLARIGYLAITDTENLNTIDDLTVQAALASLAVHFGQHRLIDNVILSNDKLKRKSGRLKLG